MFAHLVAYLHCRSFGELFLQEVGWVSDPLVREARDSKFTHPKHTCDITRFAANIISASCVDPFKKSAPK